MIFINIDTVNTAAEVAKVCEKYKGTMFVDIVHGRYTVDGCSVLGVASLSGNIVKVEPSIDDPTIINSFINDIKEIGGWVTKETK